ncbi:hypothetical protein F511_18717 [Dorcoceras hygrometricum]|uniref:Uncharacterized protein n=1 Tax=Dorcoceras hygrometricum TaxID=472368 RepID=A0A2Z7BX43_9LAMI|nr:hypothetical protein F511_18717 [Dorcoceras hygrometricum]
MKIEYRLLYDIITKALTAKAGSFDVVTQERFDMMTKQTSGFGVQISLLMEGGQGIQLGQKQLRQNFWSAHFKGEAFVVPAAKRKRMTVGRAAPTIKAFSIVSVVFEVVPIQMENTQGIYQIYPVYTSALKTIASQRPNEKTTKSGQPSDGESMSLEEILMSLPEDVMLPYDSVEPDVEIRGVDEHHRSLPQIAPEEKGKKILIEYGPTGNPATEIVDLIFGDIEFFIQIRESVLRS